MLGGRLENAERLEIKGFDSMENVQFILCCHEKDFSDLW